MKLIFSLLLLNASVLCFSISTAPLQVQIQGAESDRGKILVLIFAGQDGFPEEVSKAFKQLVLVPKNGNVEFTLDDIPPGKYAITVLHDEDDDGLMTTNSFGLPQEKYGFSNNPKIYFGPPSFEKAAFELKTEPQQVTIMLR